MATMAAGRTLSFEEFADQLGDALAAVPDLREPLREIEQRMVEATQQNFAGCHAPDGTPWPPLADGSGRPPLESLAQCIQSAVTDAGVSVWIEHEAAPYHQYGTSRGIPARPMVGVTPGQAEEYGRILGGAILKKLAEA